MFLNLIPKHTYDFNQLWDLIRRRNLWLIKLRYIAVFSLLIFTYTGNFVLNFQLTNVQFIVLNTVVFIMFIVNIAYFYLMNSPLVKNSSTSLNPLFISLLQIIIDLLLLGVLSYYTGGIESPINFFYVFHMIIGSMILPGHVIYTLAITIVIFFYIEAFLEYFGLIPHQTLAGMLSTSAYNNLTAVIVVSTAFGIMVVISVFFANSLASALYRREQELRLAFDKLNEAEKTKQKYTMGIVHEIKTPIAAVQSYLDLILGKFVGEVPENIEDKVRKARIRSDEAIQIINDVLSISKLKLSEKILREPIDIKDIITTVISRRKAQAENKQITLKLVDNRDCNNLVFGDKNLLDLALSNLIGNAIKYTDSGGKIEVVLDKTQNDKTLIEICDNGIGIPKEDQENIFKEFYRASNVKDRSHEGTGLGLSVVKHIIEQHGGKISFASPSRLAENTKVGTCFRIEL
ncbi:MAG: sensor histidine kinase [Ignavibacteria bacterium]